MMECFCENLLNGFSWFPPFCWGIKKIHSLGGCVISFCQGGSVKNLGRFLSGGGGMNENFYFQFFWLANAFSSNLNTINFKTFHGGIYKFRRGRSEFLIFFCHFVYSNLCFEIFSEKEGLWEQRGWFWNGVWHPTARCWEAEGFMENRSTF